jgi:Xaa-Pro dipeptidase
LWIIIISMASRLRNALDKLSEEGLECGIVLKPENIYYLTDFFPTTTAALLLREDPLLIVSKMDQRLAEAAKVEFKAVEKFTQEFNLKYSKIGVEKKFASIEFYEKHLKGKEVRDLGFIEELRKFKEKEEIKKMKRAARITEMVMKMAAGELIGKKERDVAALAEYKLKEKASLAFDAIVAAGENSAVPHHTPGDKKIKAGEVVILDIGARVEHYNADISRTFCLDSEPELYPIALEAQKAAIRECHAGNEVKKADAAAREVFREYGCEEYFLHSTGHGIGLEVHEPPRLSKDVEGRFEKGMVVTVEPGIYKEYGIRIEDMVLVGKKAKLLTKLRK